MMPIIPGYSPADQAYHVKVYIKLKPHMNIGLNKWMISINGNIKIISNQFTEFYIKTIGDASSAFNLDEIEHITITADYPTITINNVKMMCKKISEVTFYGWGPRPGQETRISRPQPPSKSEIIKGFLLNQDTKDYI